MRKNNEQENWFITLFQTMGKQATRDVSRTYSAYVRKYVCKCQYIVIQQKYKSKIFRSGMLVPLICINIQMCCFSIVPIPVDRWPGRPFFGGRAAEQILSQAQDSIEATGRRWRRLQLQLSSQEAVRGIFILLPPPSYCTDRGRRTVLGLDLLWLTPGVAGRGHGHGLLKILPSTKCWGQIVILAPPGGWAGWVLGCAATCQYVPGLCDRPGEVAHHFSLVGTEGRGPTQRNILQAGPALTTITSIVESLHLLLARRSVDAVTTIWLKDDVPLFVPSFFYLVAAGTHLLQHLSHEVAWVHNTHLGIERLLAQTLQSPRIREE
jgi:hypothetical protein